LIFVLSALYNHTRMPTYDYECAACGHLFEVFERIHDGGTKPCPQCRKRRAERRIGAGAGLIFKGSGFYVTDSKGSSSAATGDPKKKTTRKTTEKAEAKAEKSEAKPDKAAKK
jgi:putative FmdB family regulatory protein